jgi:hypothetical protein
MAEFWNPAASITAIRKTLSAAEADAAPRELIAAGAAVICSS